MFKHVYEAFLAYAADLVPLGRSAAGDAGRLRAPLRRGANPPDEPVSRLRTSRDLSALQPRREGRPNGQHPDKGTLYWHTDGSWRERSGLATMMYSEICPKVGGETQFCDMYAAYENLSPQWKARIKGLKADAQSRLLAHAPARPRSHDAAAEGASAAGRAADRAQASRKRAARRSSSAITPNTFEGMPYFEGRQLIEELNVAATPGASRLYAQVDARRVHRLGQPLHAAPRDEFRHRRTTCARCAAARSMATSRWMGSSIERDGSVSWCQTLRD